MEPLSSHVLMTQLKAQDAPEDAQAEAAAEAPRKAELNQQLSQLESELGKYKDSAPEAANLMLQLSDEYYKHGRALGLFKKSASRSVSLKCMSIILSIVK